MKKTIRVIGLVAAAVTILAAGRTALRKLSQTRNMARLQRTANAARNKVPC